jgi:hypothetical protein
MSAIGDDELREHFEALREVDLSRVPPFAELSSVREARGDAMLTHAPWVLVAGLGALAAAAMLAIRLQRPPEAEWLEAAAAISAWQAPTDALLESSNGSMLGGPTTLGTSVLDSIIPPSRPD